MQQFERELQYICGSVSGSGSGMGNNTKSSSVVDGGNRLSISSIESSFKIL